VRVLLPLPLGEPYDYRVPEGLTLSAGDYVLVPLGRREVAGGPLPAKDNGADDLGRPPRGSPRGRVA